MYKIKIKKTKKEKTLRAKDIKISTWFIFVDDVDSAGDVGDLLFKTDKHQFFSVSTGTIEDVGDYPTEKVRVVKSLTLKLK